MRTILQIYTEIIHNDCYVLFLQALNMKNFVCYTVRVMKDAVKQFLDFKNVQYPFFLAGEETFLEPKN